MSLGGWERLVQPCHLIPWCILVLLVLIMSSARDYVFSSLLSPSRTEHCSEPILSSFLLLLVGFPPNLYIMQNYAFCTAWCYSATWKAWGYMWFFWNVRAVCFLWLAFVPVPGLVGGSNIYPGLGQGAVFMYHIWKWEKKPKSQHCFEG